MRTARGEKEKLKERILSEAIPFLKNLGREGAPVDQIMKKVGLTSGALYSHFKSKDDFFAQVVLRELDRVSESYRLEIEKNGLKGFKDLIKVYLSDTHIQSVEEGCVFVALGADMRRNSEGVRGEYEERIEKIFEVLAGSWNEGTREERQELVRFIMSSMIGALTYARSMKTKENSRRILNSSKKRLLDLLPST